MDDDLANKRKGSIYRGSLVTPIILITIGVVFLLENLGYISGDVWDVILKLWPLLLISIGFDLFLQGKGITGPIVVIGFGLIFLSNNFGLLEWNILDVIKRLWPILLIAVGLDLVIGRRSIWSAILALIFLLVILLAALWYFNLGPGRAVTEEISIIRQGVSFLKPILI